LIPPPSFVQATRDGVMLHIHVQPGAKRSVVAGLHGDRLKLRVAAPPIDGAANLAVVEMLSELLDVPKSCVVIQRGETHRDKSVSVTGVTIEQASRLIES